MTERPGATMAAELPALLDLPLEKRVDRMTELYGELAKMDSPERRDALKEQVAVVYRMGEGDLRAMTEGRLRAWLRMDRQAIRPVADDFESVLDEMPADLAMRRVTVVQLVSGELSPEERQELRDLVPKVLGNEPPPIDGTAAAEEPARHPWWAFWRK